MAHLPANRVKGYVLGFVQYVAGSGVYSEKHRLWLPHMLPRPSRPTDEWWPLLICGLDDESNRQYGRVLHDADKDEEECMEVDLDGDENHSNFMHRMGMNPEPEEEPGAGTSSSSRTSARCITTTVYATCAKQGLESTPTAWPIIMRSRL